MESKVPDGTSSQWVAGPVSLEPEERFGPKTQVGVISTEMEFKTMTLGEME